MILEAGMVVPPFMPDQSVQLRVNSITADQIEFVWLEKQRTGLPPRTLLMPIKMKPVVRYAMPGQGRMDGVANAPIMGARATATSIPEVTEVEPKRAVTIDDEPTAEPNTPKSAARKKSAADAVLDMFFNQDIKVPEPK
jgi:hypothetical protein